MYSNNTFLSSDGQGSAFQNSGSKSYTNFTGGTNPPARNYGVGAGVTTLNIKCSKKYTRNSHIKSLYKI